MPFDLSDPKWTDWHWQQAHACQDPHTLRSWAESAGFNWQLDTDRLHELISVYRLGVTPYYFSLIRKFNETDPVYRQVIPAGHERVILPEESEDPIGDEHPGRGSRPLKALIHRYPNRVLLLPTALCAVYCRFCFRKRLVGDTAHNARAEDLQEAYRYIEAHPEIEEVILTGGDPLTLGDRGLISILKQLEAIDHLRLIRIHTRLPVVNPFRLTEELGQSLLKLEKPVWISTHFNHVQEIGTAAVDAISLWTSYGIPFLNQSVLLKGVNDSATDLRDLFMRLIEIKIRPYYLHQADLVPGTSHLRVSITRGLNLMHQLQGELPGYAIPRYMLDNPDGTGKIPLDSSYSAEVPTSAG